MRRKHEHGRRAREWKKGTEVGASRAGAGGEARRGAAEKREGTRERGATGTVGGKDVEQMHRRTTVAR